MRLSLRRVRRHRPRRTLSGLMIIGLGLSLTSGCSDEPSRELGEMSFGDPGELDGFDPVTDTDTYELESLEETAEPIATPDEVLAETPAVSLEDGGEVLAQVAPVDETPSSEELPDDRDGKRRNEIGELITIDDVASVACGNVEIAVNELDAGDFATASERLNRAAELAGESKTVGMDEWVLPLGDQAEAARASTTGVDPQLLIAFLAACSDGGYEL